MERDYLLKPSDFDNIDLVVSLGGDGTFLKTASMIDKCTLPIFGVNTDPTRSVGFLTSIPIPIDNFEKEIKKYMHQLDNNNFSFVNKQRIKVTSKSQVSNDIT